MLKAPRLEVADGARSAPELLGDESREQRRNPIDRHLEEPLLLVVAEHVFQRLPHVLGTYTECSVADCNPLRRAYAVDAGRSSSSVSSRKNASPSSTVATTMSSSCPQAWHPTVTVGQTDLEDSAGSHDNGTE